MKLFILKKWSIAVIIQVLISHLLISQTIMSYKTGTHNGYFYELWEEFPDTEAEMTLKGTDGSFEFTWNSENTVNSEIIAGTGLEKGKGDEIIEFVAEIESNGNAYLSVNGWFMKTNQTTSPSDILAEFSIIENAIGWDVSQSKKPIDSIYSDGSYYRIYSTLQARDGLASLYYDVYFVRRDKRTEGIITFNNHYKKLLEHFEQIEISGHLGRMLFSVETYMSKGHCNVTKMVMKSDVEENYDIKFNAIQENDEFLIGDEITISVNISPKQGSIEKVEYFAGNQKIGEAKVVPYEISWVSDLTGSIPITIIATNSEGQNIKNTTTIIVNDKNQCDTANNLIKGWNIIGYMKKSDAIENALADIWDNVEIVKDFESFYEKGQNINSLKELHYGKGYFVKISKDCFIEW